ncbi:MAG: glycosyltransferase involved in cell wall biosynthesis [Candidatus Marinamargulisbacteria bacterium]|jgi:glycosyltransferase involved in cell wall biosynthesis
MVSVIIPCYNESATIEALIDRVLSSPVSEPLEIIVVDDGSDLKTIEILQEKIAPKISKVIYQTKNQGKGAAVRVGLAAATGEIAIIQDADMEYDPHEFPALLAPILKGEADVVYGSRFLKKGANRDFYLLNFWANKFLTFLSNRFTRFKLTDMETCYKVFRRFVYQQLKIQENRFGLEPEMTAKINQLGVSVKEIPIRYQGRSHRSGKKIGWKDGVSAIICIFKYNFGKSI